ncbi:MULTISPECIES: hypothetical protein [unclassified Microcoleus]|uniref:hypothetical protein n=1 Tax=unclassified Microcoleus TaxID=2642155 RepID=UPI0025F2D150|nr:MULTISPECIES: hypothetical protein [unclassified Microcoleus]
MLTVYAKSEQVDIAAEDIQNIITEYEQPQSENRHILKQSPTCHHNLQWAIALKLRVCY